MLNVAADIRIPDSELQFQYVRSSGPGGQNVNKVSSKAVLRWNVRLSTAITDEVRQRFLAKYAARVIGVGEVLISSQRYRDQHRNAADCLEKLRAMLAAVARPPKRRRATKPTAASRQRRVSEKKLQSQKKQTRRPATGDE